MCLLLSNVQYFFFFFASDQLGNLYLHVCEKFQILRELRGWLNTLYLFGMAVYNLGNITYILHKGVIYHTNQMAQDSILELICTFEIHANLLRNDDKWTIHGVVLLKSFQCDKTVFQLSHRVYFNYWNPNKQTQSSSQEYKNIHCSF